MIDSVGNVSSVVVVGSGNPLCLSTLDRIVGPRLEHAFLIDSDEDRLIAAAHRTADFGVADIRTGQYEVDDAPGQRALLAEAFALNDVDVAIVAPLGPQLEDSSAASDMRAELIDLVAFGAATLDHLTKQGHGVLILFSHSKTGPANSANLGHRMAQLGADSFAATVMESADPRVKVISVRLDPTASMRGREGGLPEVHYRELADTIAEEVRATRQRRQSVTIDYPRTARAVAAGLRRTKLRLSK